MSFAPGWRMHTRTPGGDRVTFRSQPARMWLQFRGPQSGVVFRSLGNQRFHTLSGVTRDSAGTVLASCVVDMFRTTDDTMVATTTSDGSGAFTLTVSAPAGPFYLVAYKAGSPDVAGTTVNTLIAT